MNNSRTNPELRAEIKFTAIIITEIRSKWNYLSEYALNVDVSAGMYVTFKLSSYVFL